MKMKPDHQHLFRIAAEQLGYFTASQARECGFSWDLLSHHTSTGRFHRALRGIYRLRDFPWSEHEEIMIAWLAVGKDDAVVSHESALEILDLSDIIPSRIHLTLPRSMRYRTGPPGATINTTKRIPEPAETQVREGIRITSATRTLVDCAEAGVALDQLEIAIAQALIRGLTTIDQIQTAAKARSQRVQAIVERSLPLVGA
ncbi:MAG: type IV toxin-antitoxin system AbiEi family antitoxin domain-containing protein [Chloroflexota bacterium]